MSDRVVCNVVLQVNDHGTRIMFACDLPEGHDGCHAFSGFEWEEAEGVKV